MLLATHNNGVPGIRASRSACEDIEVWSENVNDLPFSLVPPLGANHCSDGAKFWKYILHLSSSLATR
jgi:hypothetical protein